MVERPAWMGIHSNPGRIEVVMAGLVGVLGGAGSGVSAPVASLAAPARAGQATREAAPAQSPERQPTSSAAAAQAPRRSSSAAPGPALRDVRLEVDKETGRTVYKLLDRRDGKVVLQSPPEEILAMVRNLRTLDERLESIGLLLDREA